MRTFVWCCLMTRQCVRRCSSRPCPSFSSTCCRDRPHFSRRSAWQARRLRVLLLLLLLLFLLLSVVTREADTHVRTRGAGGDTTLYTPTWSQVWCQCLQFSSRNNRSADDMTLYRLPFGTAPPLNRRHSYDVTQRVGDPDLTFEYYEAIMHPGAKASARFAFNVPVTAYFAARFDVDGQDHDPDYQTHFVWQLSNVTSGVVYAPAINASGTWAFVWDKNFKLQSQTVGTVAYHFDMVEYAQPVVDANETAAGEGRFCWESGQVG